MPVVSVIIPTYKRADFLRRAIDSVLAQSFSDLEVVVVDDNGEGSPHRESTERVVHAIGDARVRLLQNPRNLGGGPARNAGIAAARGEFITFLDDDDIYLPEKLSVQVAAMRKYGWDLSFMDCEMRATDGTLMDVRTHDLPMENDSKALLRAHLLAPLTPTATYMYTAEALARIGGFEDRITAQEYMLMLKSITSNLRIGYLKQSQLVQYLHEQERISVGANKLQGERNLLEIRRQYFDVLTPAERRRVLCRHHCVLFFACFKRREYAQALRHAFCAVTISPSAACAILKEKKRMLR